LLYSVQKPSQKSLIYDIPQVSCYFKPLTSYGQALHKQPAHLAQSDSVAYGQNAISIIYS